MTADPERDRVFDTILASVYQRTGEVFYAWSDPALAPPDAPLQPVCRFSNPSPLIDSFMFTAIDERVPIHDHSLAGNLESRNPAAFYVLLSDSNGGCPAGSLPVYRFFNNRNDANMRHTLDLTVRREMLNKQWAPNGFGPNGVAFCSPVYDSREAGPSAH